MKILVNRKTLVDALLDVSALAGKSKTLPIYNNVKIKTKDNKIRLQTSDVENSIRRYIVADDIDADGSFLVDCKSLTEYVKAVRDDQITLLLEEGQLKVKHSKGKASFAVMPPDDFAEPTFPQDAPSVTIKSYMLAEAIDTGRRFVSTDEFRPALQHINAYIQDGKFGYSATDTRRMVLNEIPIEGEIENFSWLISSSVSPMLYRFSKCVEEVKIIDDSRNIIYQLGDIIVFAAKIQGQFPDCKRIIPKDNHIEWFVDKKEINDAVHRAMLISNQSPFLVKLTASPIDIVISSESIETGKRATESITAECSQEMEIGFNGQMLLETINSATGNKVKLTLKDKSRPILVVEEESPLKSILLMPMSLV